ncbi:MAG: MBL fold metallo-hydrolase [Rhodovulum sulfidophilum]|uniref:MBL fold metallo-hydrolase n=1 Tax=Rhodovulum sulfidophilum TaxID=35806 RepID=A0A2W5N1D6_RHOSU|nr:MAG: MBL fold metallo-hydrolase [Rhodovulum sulfidophilum]
MKMANTRKPGPIRALTAAVLGGVLLNAAGLLGPNGVVAQPAQVAASGFRAESGDILVRPVQQMSVVIETPGGVIYTDPTGGADRYAAHPRPDLILISHEHDEHYDARTLEELVGPGTRIVVPPYIMERLPRSLRGNAIPLANGTGSELAAMRVEAIPAYGLGGEAARWHPRGRGNAYVVTVDGRRLYIGGSTEGVPEMLELRGIDIAFLPLYPPYALGPEEAARVASVMRPKSIYIYQYDSLRSRDEFARRIGGLERPPRVVAPDIP